MPDQFHKSTKNKSGLKSACKNCVSIDHRTGYRKKHPDQKCQRYETNIGEGKKWCPHCHKWKDVDDFNYCTCSKRAYNREAYCRQCQSDKHLMRRFGLTREDYLKILDQQNGRCACCGTLEPGGRGSFHVDHNHVTGEIRGLLCRRCNNAIGQFEDSAELLKAAIDYLNKSTNPHS
jgi:hypothetical protein